MGTTRWLALALLVGLAASGCSMAARTASSGQSPSTSVATTATQQAAPSGGTPTTSPPSASVSTAPVAPASSAPKAGAPGKALHHPAVGTSERKAILDALRPAIRRELGQKVIFEVHTLNVADEFAFAIVVPRTPSGGKIDYTKTRYANEYRMGDLDGGANADVLALLRYRAGEWTVVTFEIGPTDVAYADWWRRFGAPKSIFPYTE